MRDGGRSGRIRIGVSGWTYAGWRGHFYPESLAQHRELAFAASAFPSIEINGSFYRLQRPSIYRRWAGSVPDGFVFAVKGPRFITHMRRLREPETPLANFFASGVLALGSRLGPILWQFPASFRYDADLLERFLAMLPRDSEAAAALAARHDEGVAPDEPPAALGPKRAIRHAVEIRHESFRDPDFIALLRRQRVALVCADTVEWPRLMDLTADFAYLRLHGSGELYRSRYDDDALDRWAALARAFAEGRQPVDVEHAAPPERDPPRRDVFIYFDNTDKRHAPEDARRLMARLGIGPVPAAAPSDTGKEA